MSPVQPTTRHERLEVLDALRGFALFGILLANLVSFFGYAAFTSEQLVRLPIADRSVLFFIDWFVEGKFYGLFSILFGIGFGLQAARMRQTPEFFKAYWYRRMVVLLLIGLIHMNFIWNGDILTLYAVLGMLLPLFMNLSDRALIRWIVCLLTAPIIIYLLTYLTNESPFWGSLSRISAELKNDLGYGERTLLEMRTSGSVLEVFWVNVLNVIPRPMSYLLSGRYPQVLGLFLIGVYLARQLPAIATGRIALGSGVKCAFVVGLLCSLAYAWIKGATGTYYSLTPVGAVQAVVYHIGAPLLSMGIGWVFVIVWNRAPTAAVFTHLATLGRMALTNYLFQTSVSVVLFFGYGFGLMRELPFAVLPVFAIGILLCQWLLSHYWLQTRPQGPLESLWKRVAYVKRHSA